MTGVVGTLLEAWGEVRVHRARVVLSLVGVVLAVFAMTIVTAGGTLARQVVLEAGERASGRSTTLHVSAMAEDPSLTPVEVTGFLTDLVDRYGVEHSSLVYFGQLDPMGRNQGVPTSVQFVEPDYAVIHRLEPLVGRWLVDDDAQSLAPTAVANTRFLKDNGLEGAVPPFTVTLPGPAQATAVVVGVVEHDSWNATLMMLPSTMEQVMPAEQAASSIPSLELWVPPQDADVITAEVGPLMQAGGMFGEATRMSQDEIATLLTAAQWGVRVLSWFALLLGAVGVLNVGVVTVRQRVREIGVRRALGASSGRVFAAVVLESVCATVLAGLVGIGVAVAMVVNLPLDRLLGSYGISDVPGFPVSAALEALVATTVVGALVGLVPATMAVRSKVIDAIRY